MKKILAIISSALIVASFTACGSDPAPQVEQKKPFTVLTTNFPTYDIAKQLIKENGVVSVINDKSSYEYQYTPKDINQLNNADIFFYMGKDEEPWVAQALEDENMTNDELMVVDVTKDIEIKGNVLNYADTIGAETTYDMLKDCEGTIMNQDIAYWLNIENAIIMTNTIQEHISNVDYKNETAYVERAQTYITSLRNLKERYERVSENSTSSGLIIVGNFEYFHLAQWLDLKIISAYDKEAIDEITPSTKRLVNIIDFINKNKTKYIVSDETASLYAVKAIQADTTCEPLYFNTMVHMTSDDYKDETITYYSIMEQNYIVFKNCII